MDAPAFAPALPARALAPNEEPVWCFTTDVEWAPEWAIGDMLSFFAERGVPLTPFVTHQSPLLEHHYGSPSMRRRAGVHPNFLPGGSHGETVEEVIDTVLGLWPDALGFRSHWFYEDSRAVTALHERGMLYDSNLCLFLQPGLAPLLHHVGLIRFPVFWEDDVHFGKRLDFDLGPFRAHFETPGLKVINIHPLLFALNVPTTDFYDAHRHLNSVDDPDAMRARFAGSGVRTFVGDLIDHVADRSLSATYLDDLYLDAIEAR